MDGETQKIIQEQMKRIPEDVATAIISVEYQSKLQEVVKRQHLMIDQAGKLEMETTLVMIGLEPITDYTANLQRELELTTMRAKEIAADVSENIFKPVRESLQKMSQTMEEDGEGDSLQVPGVSQEEEITKFTNNNETNLNRDQILNEIENPAIIEKGGQSMNFTKGNSSNGVIKKGDTAKVVGTELEIRPDQEIKTIPGQIVKDIAKEPNTNIYESKMTETTVTPQQIVNAKPEIKLPEVTKRSLYNTDPYREPIE